MGYRKDITDKIKASSKDTESYPRTSMYRGIKGSTSTSSDSNVSSNMYRGIKSSDNTETASADNTRPGMRKADMSYTTKTESTTTPSSASNTMSSFGKAFSEAKKSGNKDFEYQGKKYAAVTKEEVDKSGAKNLTEYLNKNKSTAIADKGKTEPDDYSQLDTSVQRTPTAQGKTEPDDYSQLDSSVQKTEAAADSSDIFSTAKDYVKRTFGLRKGGMPDDVSMERARGVTPEQYAEEHKTPYSKNTYKDGGDIHITKGHDYIKDLL